MREHNVLPTLIFMAGLTAGASAQELNAPLSIGPICSMAGAVEKVFTANIASGTAVYQRLQAHQESAGNLGDFLGLLHEVSWTMAARQRVEALKPQAQNILGWTGNKAVAVGVYIRSAGDSVAIAGVFPIGTGSCLQDVLLDNYIKQVPIPSLLDIPEGWTLDWKRSFYVSIEQNDKGEVVAYTAIPGSMEPYRTWVPHQEAAMRILRQSGYTRRAAQLINVAEQAARNERDMATLRRLEAAAKDLASFAKRRTVVQDQLQKALEADRAAQRAGAWIGYLQAGLTFAVAAQNVMVALSETAPKSVLDEAAAADAQRLPQIVEHYQAAALQEKTMRMGEYTMVNRDIQIKEVFILDTARGQQAPEEALILPPLE